MNCVGFFLTFDMAIDNKFEVQNKEVVFKANIMDHGDHVSNSIDKIINKSIVIFARNFSNVMRILDKRSRNNVFLNVKDKQQQNMKSGSLGVEEEIVKDKTLTILTDPKESNVVNVKDLGISKSNVLIF